MEFTNLFGNNMSVMLPVGSKDISKIREMPDNQEVFTHASTDQSLIIEILEYVQEDDEQAVKTHLEDVSTSNDSTGTNITALEQIPSENLQMAQCKTAYFVSSQQMISKFNENAKNTINVHIALFRLPDFRTDILMSFNDTVSISPQSSSHGELPAQTQPWTLDNFKQMMCSVQIHNSDFLG